MFSCILGYVKLGFMAHEHRKIELCETTKLPLVGSHVILQNIFRRFTCIPLVRVPGWLRVRESRRFVFYSTKEEESRKKYCHKYFTFLETTFITSLILFLKLSSSLQWCKVYFILRISNSLFSQYFRQQQLNHEL